MHVLIIASLSSPHYYVASGFTFVTEECRSVSATSNSTTIRHN